ncbi:MAG TPA: VWA domain-containing protein [Pyrinomonadaceae bacterium]|nr:VWA domain-containing protein [Pyrinomonadaceae bacterium]
MMIQTTFREYKWLAFAIGVLAIFLLAKDSSAQTTKDLPPAPPPWKAKPTPTPTPKPAEPEVLDVVRVESNLVMVPVSVTDSFGKAVQGLQISDFRLEEEGKQQEIAQIGDPEQVPLEIALLLDVSGSTNTRFEFEKEAAARFLKEVLKKDDRASLFIIDRTPIFKQSSTTADEAAIKLMSFTPAADKGPTAFYDTVVNAAQYLQKTPARHRRVIVVISDGADNFSEVIKKSIGTTLEEQASASVAVKDRVNARAIAEVEKNLQRADAVFYSINPAGNTMYLNVITRKGQEGMQRLANSTGGNTFIPETESDLGFVFSKIAAELRGQYLLQYYANADAPAGQFRKIIVSVPTHGDLKVRARQGYYPKKSD